MEVDMNVKELLFIEDSNLLIHQIHEKWSTKNVKILMYLQCVKELCKKFTKIEFKHVPKIQKEFPDALATLSSMIQHPHKKYIDPEDVEIMDQHAYLFHVDGEPDAKPCIVQEQPRFRFVGCVDDSEETSLLEEIHAGMYGPHMNGFTLAKKILRAGYFWMTMESDSIRYIHRCHQSQINGDFIEVSPNELNIMGSPWPFAASGIDVNGLIQPTASNEHHFILVAIDYFNKWVELRTYKVVTKKVVADFGRNKIVYRFGIPESIITNNAANLNSDLMREICENFRII
nr:uncharacterized protein LOC117281700 [Nicotiana tomentosiformis]